MNAFYLLTNQNCDAFIVSQSKKFDSDGASLPIAILANSIIEDHVIL